MTEEQNASLLFSLYQSKNIGLEEQLDYLMGHTGIAASNLELTKAKILEDYNNGIRQLNPNQFDNLVKMTLDKSIEEIEINNKLNFYEIEKESHQNIISFLYGFKKAHETMNVDKMDASFQGVQVATYDDFSKILQLGYTGDWVIDPRNVKPLRIQIASMTETGSYTRGYYINADIERMEPVDYDGKTRYRIYLANPIVVNSGNRNIKFSNNPVRYVR